MNPNACPGPCLGVWIWKPNDGRPMPDGWRCGHCRMMEWARKYDRYRKEG